MTNWYRLLSNYVEQHLMDTQAFQPDETPHVEQWCRSSLLMVCALIAVLQVPG
jgi:hypothetical protein